MKAYLSIIRMRFILLLQYRAAAIAGICTQLLFGFVRVMLFEAFYRSSSLVQPMSYSETITYIWIGQALLGVLPWSGDSEIQEMVRSGNVAYELCRPLNLYNQWYSRAMALRTAPTLLRSIPIFIVSLFFLPSKYSLSYPASYESFAMWVLSTFFAILLASAITNILNIIVMWTVSGEGIIRLAPTIVSICSGMIVPIPFFPKYIGLFLRILPFSGIVDTPLRLYSGSIPVNQWLPLILHQIIWVFLLVALGHFLINKGTKKIVLQGG